MEEKHGAAVIAESAAFIDRLLHELLEMAAAESDTLELAVEPVPMAGFLEAIVERTISTVDRPRVRLEVAQAVTALIEPRRLERVVANFLQNALKYSPPGSPIVLRLTETAGTAMVSVADQGPGLSNEEASFVFDKYRRTRAARRAEGLGLGLFISRKIVEAHGGSIGVESTPGQGATFFFRVPLAHGASALPPAPGAPVGRSQLRGLRVLLVDDEANALSALQLLLGEEGLTVTGATSGDQALALAQQEPPDVAVLDVHIPGIRGVELVRRLRERQPDLPAVIMSGFMAHHPEIAEVREATGAAYVGKPVDPDELLRVLERVLVHYPHRAA
ncbi:MAG: ATP-binding protein [Myxococcaceae bacterium]